MPRWYKLVGAGIVLVCLIVGAVVLLSWRSQNKGVSDLVYQAAQEAHLDAQARTCKEIQEALGEAESNWQTYLDAEFERIEDEVAGQSFDEYWDSLERVARECRKRPTPGDGPRSL